MIFSNLSFWGILIIGIIVFYLFPFKYRWTILLGGSLFYLGYLSPSFLVYAISYSIANYFFGIMLEKAQSANYKKKLYQLFLFLNIGQLVAFKYINFLIENLNHLFIDSSSIKIPYLNVLIPIGISYYTFQCIGYLTNIKRGQEKAENHFGYFLIYNLFFPKILSGPIERSDKFLPQLRSNIPLSPEMMQQGINLILLGIFKKFVIADRLGIIVNGVYGNINDYSGSSVLLVMFLQAFYVYADFSGYTDMALGTANFFGIKLTNNFKRPFFAPNVSDFWRRWHISLSSWCNHYIFNTIIFKRRRWGKTASTYGVFITFLIIGIWHGPNWTFVILGILHGLAINYEYFTKRKRLSIGAALPNALNISLSRIITFTFCCFALIFFFSKDVNQALNFIKSVFSFNTYSAGISIKTLINLDFIIAVVSVLILMVGELLEESGIDLLRILNKQPVWAKWAIYYFVIFMIFIFGKFSDNNFIYFQF